HSGGCGRDGAPRRPAGAKDEGAVRAVPGARRHRRAARRPTDRPLVPPRAGDRIGTKGPDYPAQDHPLVQSRPTSAGRLNLAGVPADHPVQRPMARSSSKTLVGLDIQPGYVAAVEGRSGQVAVERAASAALAPGIVRDGEVVDVETLSSVLRDMFAE